MKYNRYSGDPAIKITPNGAKMLFKSGQPIMDQGLENAALISLFTRNGWWGNALIKKESQNVGSDFELPVVITGTSTLNDKTDEANRALKWMQDEKIASRIEITVTNPRSSQLYTKINIFPVGRDLQQLLLLQNGLNWIAQMTYPADERMKEVQ